MWTATPGTPIAVGGEQSYKRILVPVGVGGVSNEARQLAASLCDSVGGVVRLVHVRTWEVLAPACRAEMGGSSVPIDDLFAETPHEAARVLEGALHQMDCVGVPAHGRLLEAQRTRIASAIAAEAASWGADVIVMTRRARRALGVLLLGSISDEVVRGVRCPVLVARPEPEKR